MLGSKINCVFRRTLKLLSENVIMTASLCISPTHCLLQEWRMSECVSVTTHLYLEQVVNVYKFISFERSNVRSLWQFHSHYVCVCACVSCPFTFPYASMIFQEYLQCHEYKILALITHYRKLYISFMVLNVTIILSHKSYVKYSCYF
jgi:hypothetical protein